MKKQYLIVSLAFLFLARVAFATEALPPTLHVVNGSMFAAEAARAILWIVLLKCVFFVLIERSIPWFKAFLLMLLANFFSIIIGFAAGLTLVAPLALILVVPVLFWISWTPAKHLVEEQGGRRLRGLNPVLLVLTIVALFLASWYLYFRALRGDFSHSFSPEHYLLQLVLLAGALFSGVVISTFWEEWIVAGFAANKKNQGQLLPSVWRANLVAFIAIMLYIAIVLLPDGIWSGDALAEFALPR